MRSVASCRPSVSSHHLSTHRKPVRATGRASRELFGPLARTWVGGVAEHEGGALDVREPRYPRRHLARADGLVPSAPHLCQLLFVNGGLRAGAGPIVLPILRPRPLPDLCPVQCRAAAPRRAKRCGLVSCHKHSWGSLPFKAFPSPGSRTASRRPLPSWRFPSGLPVPAEASTVDRKPRLQGVAPPEESVARAAV